MDDSNQRNPVETDVAPVGELITAARREFLEAAAASSDQLQLAGIHLLELAATAQDAAIWQSLAVSGELQVVELAMTSPEALLDALEQESYAPVSTGLPGAALARIEEIGHRHASEPALARGAERLLHAAGETAAAYRVEHARRAAAGVRSELKRRPQGRSPKLGGITVVIAGGHPALRARVARELRSIGAGAIREIPSAKEASRLTRDVLSTIAGSDLVLVFVRSIAHSTSDQIRVAATRTHIPVLLVETASTGGVRRVLEAWLANFPETDTA